MGARRSYPNSGVVKSFATLNWNSIKSGCKKIEGWKAQLKK